MRCQSAVPVVLLAMVAGCGGSKSDFSAQPTSFSASSASPKDAKSVVLNAIARDGRLLGTYLDAKNKPAVFGWVPDGQSNTIVTPTECKVIAGINELGAVSCADTASKPARMFQWQGGALEGIQLPKDAVLDSFGAITYNSFFLTNLHVGAGQTQGYQLKINEKPRALTAAGGTVSGSSLSGNIAGTEPLGANKQAIAVINSKKSALGLLGGLSTSGASINDAGTLAGNQDSENPTTRAFTWSKGQFTLLPMPAGATRTVALDINNFGVVCGYAVINGQSEACVWYPKKAPVLLKDLTKLEAGVKLVSARLVTPLGIVVCEGTRTVNNVTNSEVFGLFPSF